MSGARLSRPNIVLIMADDMGFSDVGCYGSEIATPNIDRLGFGGLRMTQFYNNARCCPTRASLLTGLYPTQAGIGHMNGTAYNGRAPADSAEYQGYFKDSCVTLAEALRPAGYRTAFSGKWHVAGLYQLSNNTMTSVQGSEVTPINHGFERSFGILDGVCSYFYPHSMFRDNERVEPDCADGDYYFTDVIADEAIGQIEELAASGSPFFSYICFTAPHSPLHALREDIERYRGTYLDGGWDRVRAERYRRLKELGIIAPEWPLSPRDPAVRPWDDVVPKDWNDARMAVYAAQVDRIDQNVGRIMARLRQLGVEDNTLVIFLSDNGGAAEFLGRRIPTIMRDVTCDGRPVQFGNDPAVIPGPADVYQTCDRGWANAQNTPFVRHKRWTDEGGISTPFIAYWPAALRAAAGDPGSPLRPGALYDRYAHVTDLMPTLLELADADYPTERAGTPVTPHEGVSLASLLRGDPGSFGWSRGRPIFWEHEGNRAVRMGRWKLLSDYPGTWKLHDMEVDRTEQHDLSAEMPDKVETLSAAYQEWVDRVGVLPWENGRYVASS